MPSFSPSSTPPKNSTRALYLTCDSADFPTTAPRDWLPGAKQFKTHILHHSQEQARACSTKSEFSCGTGILPVHKKLIENGATSQFKIDLTVNGKDLEETVERYLCLAKESGAAIAKNSLLAVKNDA